jgi:hypothetical protein
VGSWFYHVRQSERKKITQDDRETSYLSTTRTKANISEQSCLSPSFGTMSLNNTHVPTDGFSQNEVSLVALFLDQNSIERKTPQWMSQKLSHQPEPAFSSKQTHLI